MLSSIQRAMIGAAAAGALTLAFAASGWSMHRGASEAVAPAEHAARIVHRMDYKMNFSEEQEEAITGIFADAMQASADMRSRMRELRHQLGDLRSDYDAQAAEQLSAEVGELTAALMLNRVTAQAEVYQLLSLEQRGQMDQWMQKRNAQEGQHRYKRMRF